MLRMMLEGSLEVNVEAGEIITIFDVCMAEWQIIKGASLKLSSNQDPIRQDIQISSLQLERTTKTRGRIP